MLQLHITPRKTVTGYIVHITLKVVTSNIITYYICSLQAVN